MSTETKRSGGETSKRFYPAGLYRFDRGEEFENEPMGRYSDIISREHPIFGTTQSDGLVRQGYKFIRPATAEELTEADVFSNMAAKPVASVDGVSRKEYDSLAAKFAEMEARINAEVLEPEVAIEPEAPVLGAKTLEKMNLTQLMNYTVEHGLEIGLDSTATKAEIVKAIKAAENN